ncbi:MAG: thiamine pyrophosphate-requiring protein [Burkholderiales bacterium]|nr:thiamine pyrophosphate-requiring protein [Burkholderiales bacterium]
MKAEHAELTTVATTTVAEAWLALLKARGIDYLYVNAGTDTPPLIEAYARAAASGLLYPEPIVCPHENLAVGMAHGYALATGRAQAVMLHVSVGTANAVCALMNAARDQVPLLLAAGRTPLFESGRTGARNAWIHWAQEMYDQAGMLRELVKWDYELRDGLNVREVTERALAITHAAPRGPVYLTLPREVIAAPLEQLSWSAQAPAAASEPHPDPAQVATAAEWIASARAPLIIAAASGRDPRAVTLLAEIAETWALPVVENKARMICLPADSPAHAGFEAETLVGDADVVLTLESDVPWIPRQGAPKPEAKVIQVGVDPLWADYPVRSHRADLIVTAGAAPFLAALKDALVARRAATDAETKPAQAARATRLATIRDAQAKRNTAALDADRARGGAITKTWLSHCLNLAKPADAIVVNEYWALRQYLHFNAPGSFYSLPPAGGLGWGLPAAMGIRQARPEATVIATIGDGAYIFANPAACHQAAAAHGIPVLTIVCNNGKWGAVELATKGMYGQGAAAKAPHVPLSPLAPSPDFEKYCEASGGYGEKVSSREQLPGALARGLAAVREGRQALLNVICE